MVVLPHVRRHVVGSDNSSAVPAGANVEDGDQAVLCLRARLARDQVALAEDDERAAETADRLHDVDMLSDDRVDRVPAEKRSRQPPLLAGWLVGVLLPPVQVHDHEVGPETPRPTGVALDALLGDQVQVERVRKCPCSSRRRKRGMRT